MAFHGCESIFEPILGFPPDFKLGDQYLLCGLSVLTSPERVWSPTTKPKIDEAHITWWRWWRWRDVPVKPETDCADKPKVWAIVVGEPEAGDDNALRPGTYLLVHGECDGRTPGKIGINYCWTHNKKKYQVYEEIHNKTLGPDSKLGRLNFGENMEDFLRKLRKSGKARKKEDWKWKALVDDILQGKRQGIRATWRSFMEPPEVGHSSVAESAHASTA
ncbi:hypothetical protein F5Y12DRAFT_714652 [Xylaria sp. FL1777]|nr:hypothetical protein F5Y12DRAFT_714652 [Xylaria sp. FL1777]